MIIVRSPLRITLGGGGTDLPSYADRYGGFWVSAAIDRYVYITIHHAFNPGITLRYSQMERVEQAEAIQHPIFREALKLYAIDDPLEVSSLADIPAGTGLGSSGSFTTALLKALSVYKRELHTPHELAEAAFRIEAERLHEPVGRQDPYIAAYGGVTAFRHTNGAMEVAPLCLGQDTLNLLEDNLLLFFTGITRSASQVLAEQDALSKANDRDATERLHWAKALGELSAEALQGGDLTAFVEHMNTQWEYKRQRSNGAVHDCIDDLYTLGRKNGALGGKLVGAGGGGFLMFYAEDKAQLRSAMRDAGLREVRFHFDFEGTKVLVND